MIWLTGQDLLVFCAIFESASQAYENKAGVTLPENADVALRSALWLISWMKVVHVLTRMEHVLTLLKTSLPVD